MFEPACSQTRDIQTQSFPGLFRGALARPHDLNGSTGDTDCVASHLSRRPVMFGRTLVAFATALAVGSSCIAIAAAAPHFRGAPAVPHAAAPAPHFAAPQHFAAPHFAARPAVPHFAAPQAHFAAPQAHFAAPHFGARPAMHHFGASHYATPHGHFAAPHFASRSHFATRVSRNGALSLMSPRTISSHMSAPSAACRSGMRVEVSISRDTESRRPPLAIHGAKVTAWPPLTPMSTWSGLRRHRDRGRATWRLMRLAISLAILQEPTGF
jgi:hypothetical protein